MLLIQANWCFVQATVNCYIAIPLHCHDDTEKGRAEIKRENTLPFFRGIF